MAGMAGMAGEPIWIHSNCTANTLSAGFETLSIRNSVPTAVREQIPNSVDNYKRCGGLLF